MNLGDFRERTSELPDNTELVIWNDEDATWYELNDYRLTVPATPDYPDPVFIMDAGQQVELQFDLAKRTGIDD